jgi:hypothetical protein
MKIETNTVRQLWNQEGADHDRFNAGKMATVLDQEKCPANAGQ